MTAASFLADVARYAGLAPLDEAGALRSRHSSHPDNLRAVDALLAELRELGYDAVRRTSSRSAGASCAT